MPGCRRQCAPHWRRHKVRSTPFPPAAKTTFTPFAPPFPTRPASLGSRGDPVRSCRKENGPRPVQKKRTLGAEPARACRFTYVRGSSESVPTKTGESSTGSRRTWAFALLCPRVRRSGRDLGVVVERPVFLNPLALCLVVDGGPETGGCGHPPLQGGWRGVRSTDSRRHTVGADALVGPRLPPDQRQRKEEGRVSGTSPDPRFPQGRRV